MRELLPHAEPATATFLPENDDLAGLNVIWLSENCAVTIGKDLSHKHGAFDCKIAHHTVVLTLIPLCSLRKCSALKAIQLWQALEHERHG